jgi:hypothetical protein
VTGTCYTRRVDRANPSIPNWVGSAAAEVVRQAQRARVVGVTRRGDFVQLEPAGIVYLTAEPWRGPLTINLPHRFRLEQGADGPAGAGVLRLGESAIAVERGQVWAAPPRPDACLTLPQAAQQARDTAHHLLKTAEDGAFPLLRAAFGLGGDPEAGRIFHTARLVIQHGESAELAQALAELAGRGTGLTPAGDDVLGGLLLAQARWGELDPHQVGSLVEAWAGRTTTLSAALLRCAAQGQADEHLIIALDSLFTGEPDARSRAAMLASYGSSSGGEALAGMSLIFAPSGRDGSPAYQGQV